MGAADEAAVLDDAMGEVLCCCPAEPAPARDPLPAPPPRLYGCLSSRGDICLLSNRLLSTELPTPLPTVFVDVFSAKLPAPPATDLLVLLGYNMESPLDSPWTEWLLFVIPTDAAFEPVLPLFGTCYFKFLY